MRMLHRAAQHTLKSRADPTRVHVNCPQKSRVCGVGKDEEANHEHDSDEAWPNRTENGEHAKRAHTRRLGPAPAPTSAPTRARLQSTTTSPEKGPASLVRRGRHGRPE
jgi:hypothetical protein